MDFAVPGIHDSQVALAVDDFSCQFERAQVSCGCWGQARVSDRRNGTSHQLDHGLVVAKNQGSPQPHLLASERLYLTVRSVLPCSHKEVARGSTAVRRRLGYYKRREGV